MTLLLVGFCFVAMPTAVRAAPEFVRLSFTSPDTDTEMSISWNTLSAASSTVEYGTSPGSLTMTATGSSITADPAFGFVHEVTLTNLQPDTLYYYRAGDAVDGWSAEYNFTTGPVLDPDCGSFRFLYLGDNRPDATLGGGQNYDMVLQQAISHNPRFFLNGGDMVEDGNNEGEWRDFFGYNDDTVPYVPYMPCMGNHDNGNGNNDNDLYALPADSGSEEYYYFTYGNAIFVSLSTESFTGGAGAFTIPTFLCGSASGRVECSGDHHYIVFDVSDDVLTMETCDVAAGGSGGGRYQQLWLLPQWPAL